MNNILDVKRLALEYSKKLVTIKDYLMKLNNPQVDSSAFYIWLIQLLQDIPIEQIELILDFDGVVADTDGVLFGPVIDNLWDLVR